MFQSIYHIVDVLMSPSCIVSSRIIKYAINYKAVYHLWENCEQNVQALKNNIQYRQYKKKLELYGLQKWIQ